MLFLQILLSALSIGVVAAVFGAALTLLGERLAVKRDPRIDEIERFLPGINCGGCGKPGCSEMAEAIFSGETGVTDCAPCTKENRQNIARVLKMPLSGIKRTVATVHCNGGGACKDKFAYQGYGDCKSAELLAGGNKACEVGCMGLSTCASVCRYNAVSVHKDRDVAVVCDALCTSCGSCLSACPKKIIGRIPIDAAVVVACSNTAGGKSVAAICKNGCVACGKCEAACPTNAIRLSNNLAAIDYRLCIKCLKCATACPRGCIHVRSENA